MRSFLIYIHGGTTFKKRKDYLDYLKNKEITFEELKNWSGEYLEENLSKYFQIIRIKMPCKERSNYYEWKIIFEKYLELLKKEKRKVIFLGYSLGAMFLVKYFSENKIDLDILSLHLVAPPFDDENSIEELSGGFKLRKNFLLLNQQIKNIYFYFSEDDVIVPLYHKKKYQEKFTQAKFFVFKDKRGHFRVEKFPELIKNLKKN